MPRSRSDVEFVPCIGLFALFAAGLLLGCDSSATKIATPTRGLTVQQVGNLPAGQTNENTERFPIQYSHPTTPRIDTGQTDALGQPVTISCASCHDNYSGRTPIESADQLQIFHRGLTFQHGAEGSQLTCLTCHQSENYNYLRLADGRSLEFRNSRQLCAQCHAKQDRDFEHGAHGGMNGYWDRTRGPQVRKSCIDCHEPHAPQFPHMLPTFKPLDRFLNEHAPHEKH